MSKVQWPPPYVEGDDYGVILGFLNIDPLWNIEIERAPGDGTGNPDTANSEVIDIIDGSRETYVDVRDSDSGPWFYRWRTNIAGCPAGSWTDWQGRHPVKIPTQKPTAPTVGIRVVDWTVVNDDRNSADAQIIIFDPTLRLNSVEFNERPGGQSSFTGWSSAWDSSNGVLGDDQIISRTVTVPFHEKHNAQVKARFEYDKREDAGTETRQLQVLTMDVDDTAELSNFGLDIEVTSESVIFSAQGDDDVAKIYGRFQTGSPPADPDGTENDGNAGEVVITGSEAVAYDTGLDAGSGETVYGKIRGENAAGELGPVLSDQLTSGGSIAPEVDLEYQSSDFNYNYDGTTVDWAVSITYTITASSGFSNSNLEVRHRIDDEDGTGTWSAWTAAPDTVEVTFTDDDPVKEIVVQARDVAQSSNPASAKLSKSVSATTEPKVEEHVVTVDSQGNISSRTKVNPRGDGGKIHLNIATGQNPSASDPPVDGTADKVIDLSSGQIEATASWSQVLSQGENVEIAARAEDPNGNPGSTKSVVRATGGRSEVNPVNISTSVDRSNSQATVSVNVVGNGSYDISIVRIDKDGTETTLASNAGVTDGGANDPTSTTEALLTKRNLILEVRVDDTTTNDRLLEKTVTFDPDQRAELNGYGINVTATGDIKVTAAFDSDTDHVDVSGSDGSSGTINSSGSEIVLTTVTNKNSINVTFEAVDGDGVVGDSVTQEVTNLGEKTTLLDDIEGGKLTKGLIEDTSGNAGIRLDPNDALPAWSRYIDLTADVAGEYFINHPALTLEGDGTADFSGEVSATSFTATGTASFDGRIFAEKSGRGGHKIHSQISGSYTIEAHLANVHRITLSGNVNIGIVRSTLSNGLITGTTILCVIDHNGHTVTWDDSLGDANIFYAPEGVNPSGSGRSVYTLTAYDFEDFGVDTYWAISLAAENLGNI